MRLQIKDAGSWRNVLNCDQAVASDVCEQAVKLVRLVNDRASLRLLNEQGQVRAICDGPGFIWREHL